jgi:hypothetical protein
VRGNFVYGRTFLHDGDPDQQWLQGDANVRVHGTTGEPQQVRFDRDERVQLQPLAARPHTSLVLAEASATRTSRRAPRPIVAVEKRPLAVYAQLTGAVT